MEKSSVSVSLASVSNVRRVLLSCKDIKRLKLKKKPSLTTKHKAERLRFAKERMHWKKKWRRVLFSNEKDSTWMVLMGSNIIFMTQEKRQCQQFDDKWEEAAWWFGPAAIILARQVSSSLMGEWIVSDT